MRKLILIFIILSALACGCSGKETVSESYTDDVVMYSESVTDDFISETEAVTESAEDDVIGEEVNIEYFKSISDFLGGEKARSTSRIIPEFDEEKYVFNGGQEYPGGYLYGFRNRSTGTEITFSVGINTYYHDFESMVRRDKGLSEDDELTEFIELEAFGGRQVLYSTDGMTASLKFMYDKDTDVNFQVSENLSEEEILEYSKDFVFK